MTQDDILNTGSEKKNGKDTYLVSDYTDTQLHRMGKLINMSKLFLFLPNLATWEIQVSSEVGG